MDQFSVGQRVRVSDGTACRRALVLCTADAGCDVEFEDTEEEESSVPYDRVSPLLAFELGEAAAAADEPPTAYAKRCKQQGNALFKLHDHAAAAEHYMAGLRALQAEARLSTGGRCLVRPAEAAAGGSGGRVRAALVMVLDEADGTADLLYEATSQPPLATLAEARRFSAPTQTSRPAPNLPRLVLVSTGAGGGRGGGGGGGGGGRGGGRRGGGKADRHSRGAPRAAVRARAQPGALLAAGARLCATTARRRREPSPLAQAPLPPMSP